MLSRPRNRPCDAYVGFQFFTYNFLPNLSTLILTPKICISQFVKKTEAVTFLFEKHLIVTFLFEKHLPVTFRKHLTVSFLFCNLNLKQKFAPTYENSNVPPPPIVVSKSEKKSPPSPIRCFWERVHLRQSFQLNWERVQHISLYEAP